MTEEIIIDCAFYKDGVCASPINKTCEYCKNIDVSKCYHKQLKRLEQENEKLKKEVKQIGSDFIKKGDYARELEQERDELKFENDRYKQLLKGCPTEDEDCGLCVIDEQNKRLKQENKELKEKYSHVLELAKTNADSNEYCLQELEQENEAFKQSEQEAIEIIADLKHQLSLYKNSHKTEQDRRRKFENALEEIRNYCDRIEQGSVIGTQDCLINSIKNITNEVLNENTAN